MKKIFILVFLFCFFFTFNSNASIKEKLIKNLENTQNISFDFKQNINDKTDTGKCIIEYPKKIYCEYNNSSKKILVSNGKHLVIKNRSSNQYYIYPIEKTALNLILNKSFLLKKIRKNKESLIDGKYYLFKLSHESQPPLIIGLILANIQLFCSYLSVSCQLSHLY